MPEIIASRNVTRGNFFPLRLYLQDHLTPYSLAWYRTWFDTDIGSKYNGSGGDRLSDLYGHEVYRNFTYLKNRLPITRESSIIEVTLGYVYPRILRQVIYYNLPHNPSIPSYYAYFKHLSYLLKADVLDKNMLLVHCLDAWVNLIDKVYSGWNPQYVARFGWDPYEDVRKYNSGVRPGSQSRGMVHVPEWPTPPIPHQTYNATYRAVWGTQEESFDIDYANEGAPYVPPVPAPAPEPVPPPPPAPEPEPAPTPPSEPTSGKDKEAEEDQAQAIPSSLPPMPTPTRTVTPTILTLLEVAWAKFHNSVLATSADITLLVQFGLISIDELFDRYNRKDIMTANELQALAIYNKIDFGAVFTGRSRR